MSTRTAPLRQGRPDGSVPRIEVLDHFSLRARIGILAALAAALAVVLVSAAAFVIVRVNILQTLDSNLLQRATAAAGSELVDPQQLATIPTEVFGAGDIRLALILADGRASSPEGEASAPPLGADELAVARGTQPSSVRTAGEGGASYRVVAVRAGPGQALVIAQRLEPTEQVLATLGVALPVVGGIGILLAALAGVAVARAGLRPVDRLTAATERVAATGDLRPIPVDGSDELARLTQSFNDMLGGLAASQEQQRRLVADAGHELRTPLTSMRTNLELLDAASRPGAPALPASDRAEILEDVQAQVAELSTLVGDLVELARDDPPHVVHEPVELTDVVLRALDRARRRASDVEFVPDVGAVDARRRRHRPGAGGAQPARQRGEVEPARSDRAGADAAARRVVDGARGGRRRAGHLRGGPAAGVRPLLPGRHLAHDAWLGIGAGDRPAGGGAARRGGVGRSRAGGRCAPGDAAARSTAGR